MSAKLPHEKTTAVLIAGPTASGKSGLALEIAEAIGGEIVNADSMQVYSVLDVLTARPSASDLARVPHHLYGHVVPGTPYSVAAWHIDAERAIADIRARGRVPVIVGGTGLYFRALTGGLSEMPDIPDELRTDLRTQLAEFGIEPLYAKLQVLDPPQAARLKPADRQRILRALEVVMATGRSIESFRGAASGEKAGKGAVIREDRASCIVLQPDRAALHAAIAKRFETMFRNGAVEEVREMLLLALDPETTAMKAIGVREIAACLEGSIAQEAAIERAIAATRQYAKRQSTWFRNQLGASWLRAESPSSAFATFQRSNGPLLSQR